MQQLNLPPFDAKITEVKGKKRIFDVIRKKYVALTPEEWVRQHFIHLMVDYLRYPSGLMAVEKLVVVNQLRQRADIVLYSRQLKPVLIVECKAPEVEVGQETLNQAARYNISLGVKYLVVTNGLTSYCVEINNDRDGYQLVSDLPAFEKLAEFIA